MELLIKLLEMLLLVLIGFLISEFQNAFLEKQEKTSYQYFSIIGVTFTQKDLQRLLFAIFLGVGVMLALEPLSKLINYKINGIIAYLITGYSPSTVMFFIKKKVKEKTGIKNSQKQSIVSHPDPDKEEK